ncbi:MAG: 2-oxoglutarate and iron-dependent oxygenase domain-containing protein, partial [Actinomycetota bacterium]
MVLVPTIDATSPSRADLHALDTACRDHGFFLLANHGLDDVLANA